MAHSGRSAILVIGLTLDENRHTTRAVALVVDLLDDHAVLITGTALDRLLDGVVGHVSALGGGERRAQPRVGFWIATATGGDGDLADHLRPRLTPFGVGCRLLALDRRPLGVSGHESAPGSRYSASVRAFRYASTRRF